MSPAPPWISLSALLILALAVLDLYAIGRAVMRGRGVDRTLAWVFAILALPVLGAAAYLFIANPSVGKTIQRKRIARDVIRKTVGERLGRLALPSSEAGSILRLATSATGLSPTAGNSVARGLETRFLLELADSTEMTARALAARSFPQRLAQGTARLFSSLL